MSYTIVVKPSARRALNDLPDHVSRRIERAIDSLASEPRPQGVRKLHGAEDFYRLRVGNYRVVYRVEDGIITVTVVRYSRRNSSLFDAVRIIAPTTPGIPRPACPLDSQCASALSIP